MADVTTITPTTKTKTQKEPEAPPATIPGTQVALLIVGTVVLIAAWPIIPWWVWAGLAVILAAVAAWWLLRARGRQRAADRRRGHDQKTKGHGRNRLGLGPGGRKGPGGRGAATKGRDRNAAGKTGTATKGRGGRKTPAEKAATRAAKKAAAANRAAARKAAATQRKNARKQAAAAKKATKNRGGRGPIQKTGPTGPAVEPWNRKKGNTKKPTTPPTPKQKPPAGPPQPKPAPKGPNTMSDHTPPGTVRRLIADHASQLQRLFAGYNPKTLVDMSDDLKTMPDAVREHGRAFKTLADRIGGFKHNTTIAGHLQVAATILGRVADQIDNAHNAFERSEAEKLDRQRNGDQNDRRGDISRHQGGA